MAVLTRDEVELVAQTHFPAIFDVDDKSLAELRKRVRDAGSKERTLSQQMTRAIRGKADQRGSSFPGNVEKPRRRKQVFAAASKRLNKEAARRVAMERREALKASARAALTLKRGGARSRKPSDQTAATGASIVENRKRRWTINRSRIGSISAATKRAQARRDSR